MGKLDGKVAFITGAARGQGRNHAVRLAEEGADIIAIDICAQVESVPYPMAVASDLDQTVDQVRSVGGRIFAMEADVRSFDDVQKVIDTGVAEFGRLDIVSANAAIVSFGSVVDIPIAAWNDVIDTNLTGVFYTIKAAIPHIIAGRAGGSIVITSSAAGLKAYAHAASYVSSKHGIVGLMRTLAIELAPHSIRVNSIHPTQVNTPMIMNDATMQTFAHGVDDIDAVRDAFAASSQATNLLPIPWVEPEDITNALLFLASDAARYITGVALPVDAGMLVK